MCTDTSAIIISSQSLALSYVPSQPLWTPLSCERYLRSGPGRLHGEWGTGNILASLNLPLTPSTGAPDPTGLYSPFVAVGVAFAGIAKSVTFPVAANQMLFDNITFGSEIPAAPVPEPTTMLLHGTGLVGVAGAAKRKKKNQAK